MPDTLSTMLQERLSLAILLMVVTGHQEVMVSNATTSIICSKLSYRLGPFKTTRQHEVVAVGRLAPVELEMLFLEEVS